MCTQVVFSEKRISITGSSREPFEERPLFSPTGTDCSDFYHCRWLRLMQSIVECSHTAYTGFPFGAGNQHGTSLWPVFTLHLFLVILRLIHVVGALELCPSSLPIDSPLYDCVCMWGALVCAGTHAYVCKCRWRLEDNVE